MMEHRKGKNKYPALWLVVVWCLCVFALIIGALWMWDFIDDIIKDALEARFEAKPPEGFAYWYGQELKKSVGTIVILISPFVVGAFLLLTIGLRWVRRGRQSPEESAS